MLTIAFGTRITTMFKPWHYQKFPTSLVPDAINLMTRCSPREAWLKNCSLYYSDAISQSLQPSHEYFQTWEAYDVLVMARLSNVLWNVPYIYLTRSSCISCSFVASRITSTFSRRVDSCCCNFSFSSDSRKDVSSPTRS